MEVEMTKLTRWEPLSEMVSMRRDLDRLFDETFFRPLISSNGWNAPLVDMYQTDEEVVVKAAMPGVSADDVNIEVRDDVLSIRAEIKQEAEDKGKTYHMREQRYSSFERSLSLPAPVVADKAEAEVKVGVLTLHLPKAEEAKPKSITVKAK
jgi:HSP20 family protein